MKRKILKLLTFCLFFLIIYVSFGIFGIFQVNKNNNFLFTTKERLEFHKKYSNKMHHLRDSNRWGETENSYLFSVINFDNIELLPVKKSIGRIDLNNLNQNAESVKRLDYLVDYYQSGLSMQIEAIFRGYGHLEILDFKNAMDLYDKIKK